MLVRAVFSKLLALAIPVALVSAIVGALGGREAAAACAVLLLTVAWLHQARNLLRLKRWLKAPSLDTLPQSMGLWEDVYAGLARLLRAQRQHATDLSRAVERFRLAGTAMPEGLVILDGDDRITPERTAPVTPGMTINVARVATEQVVEKIGLRPVVSQVII